MMAGVGLGVGAGMATGMASGMATGMASGMATGLAPGMASGMATGVVMADPMRDRLPSLWRRIEDAHYSYLEIEESPEKLRQKKKLEALIMEYLSLVPHECKFGLAETGKVFHRTVTETTEFSAYRAGIGWAAIARYAANLLAQPWRKEYKVIRMYSGFYKHEVEAHLVGCELVLQALGYRRAAGRLLMDGPACPDMAAAVSRDALIAHAECQIMVQIWEGVWGGGARVTWADVVRERANYVATPAQAIARLSGYSSNGEIYSNVPTKDRRVDELCEWVDEPVQPVNPYIMYPPPMCQEMPQYPVPMMNPYQPVPYYYPISQPYMIPTPVYAPIKQATTVPINGYPYRYPTVPTVPTAQLIEFEAPSVYENGKFERSQDERRRRHGESSKRNSTLKSTISDVSLPSLPRSDTQPSLSKAKEDGMGTYESWDYVFRNLSSKDQEGESRSGFSQSLDRDSRTLDRLDREERRTKYQPTTLDLEDGLQALNLDRSYDEAVYRTAKVNESLMRLKQEQELKKRQSVKKLEEKRVRKSETIGHPTADGLVPQKVAQDKVKLLTKKEVKDRKDVIKQQSSVNGSVSNAKDLRKLKPQSSRPIEEKPRKTHENGVSKPVQVKTTGSPSRSSSQANYNLKAQLVVSLDEPDCLRRSPPKFHNGERERASSHNERVKETDNRWECTTCTYLNKGGLVCEMCGKSRKGPEIEPLTSGGRECPACTLVNKRDARSCDACGTSLEHCPTYI